MANKGKEYFLIERRMFHFKSSTAKVWFILNFLSF